MNTPDLCKAKWVKQVFNLYPTRLKCILKFREIIGINDTDIFILSLWFQPNYNNNIFIFLWGVYWIVYQTRPLKTKKTP